MFLSDTSIKKFVDSSELLVVPPLEESNIRPCGIRVHLGEKLLSYEDGQEIDPMSDQEIKYKEIDLKEDSFVLHPGVFVLGSTKEAFKTPRNMVGFLDGRSTLARMGLTIHITAAVTDGLYEEPRTITLEMHNASNLNIILSRNMPIGSMLFFLLDQEVAQGVQEQYRCQSGVTPANLEGQFS